MTILTFPSITGPSSVQWMLRANTQTHLSPFDGTSQTLVMPGARWEATLVWDTLKASDARVLAAFLARLSGMAGRFTMPVYHAPRQAAGLGDPTPKMASGTQTGSSISTNGWAASAQAALAGDFFSYPDAAGRTLLHQVTADATANGAGAATLSIAPPVRRSVAADTGLNFTTPSGLFRLKSDDEGVMTTRPPLFGAASLSVVEALFT